MSLLKNLDSWTSTHNPKWLALFRVALGAALLLRGVSFLNNLPNFEIMLEQNSLGDYKGILVNTIPWIHIGGGFLIIIGLFTRFASFIQIPVLLGAVIFINSRKLFAAETDLSLSIILLLLLVVFVIEGSGPLSLANYFKEEQEAEQAAIE
jgi:putative oxidoreductase